jgi:hypothetical protein
MGKPATDILRTFLVAGVGLAVALLVASCNERSPAESGAGPDKPIQPEEPARDPEESFSNTSQARVGLTWDAPEGWVSVPEFKASRLDSWQITGADGSVTAFAFYFGPDRGAVIEPNLYRWGVQLRQENGVSPSPEIESWESNGLRITVATFTAESLVGMSLDELELGANGARLVGVIVEGGPVGTVFFRLSGPTRAVEGLTPAFLGMIRTIRPLDSARTP